MEKPSFQLENVLENYDLKIETIKLPTDFNGIESVRIFPNSDNVIIGTRRQGLWSFDKKASELIEILCHTTFFDSYPSSIHFHPHPELSFVYFATSANGFIGMGNIEMEKKPLDIIAKEEEGIVCADMDKKGDYFVTCGQDGKIRVYDALRGEKMVVFHAPSMTGTPILRLETGCSNICNRINSIRFSRQDEHVFATCGFEQQIKVWDIRINRNPTRSFKSTIMKGDALDIWDKTILTGGYIKENALQLWDMGSGKLIENIPMKDKDENGLFLMCARFHGQNHVVAGGEGTNSVQVIDYKKQLLYADVPMNRPVRIFDIKEASIAFGGLDNQFKIASFIKNSMSQEF